MSTELEVLALYGLLIAVTIAVQALFAIPSVGLPYLASTRDDGRKMEGINGRLIRANTNNVIAMAYFAPAVLLLILTESTTATTLLVTQVFLAARVIYVILYAAGIPWLRTGVWSIAFVAALYLYVLAFI